MEPLYEHETESAFLRHVPCDEWKFFNILTGGKRSKMGSNKFVVDNFYLAFRIVFWHLRQLDLAFKTQYAWFFN